MQQHKFIKLSNKMLACTRSLLASLVTAKGSCRPLEMQIFVMFCGFVVPPEVHAVDGLCTSLFSCAGVFLPFWNQQ